jgi:hypothetical protein
MASMTGKRSRRSFPLLVAATGVALVVTLALSAPAVGGATVEARKAAIKGSLTLKLSDSGFGDGSASGRIDTKGICAHFRAIRIKLLNPPPRYRQAEPTYGEPNRKHYTALVGIPSEPDTYRFRAVAKKTRVARGLRRAKCAKLKSPVVEVTVTA